jgi:hypothetical protein
MKRTISILLALALVLVFSLVAATPVAAATLEVGSGKPYATIQAAVNAASSGDTVLVYAGTYNEDITITKGLTLTTPSGSPATIDGGIWIKDIHTFTQPITVEHFTIQNGTIISGIKDYGIKVTGDPGAGSDVSIVDMHIVNNTFINCGKTANVADETWFNAAIFYDANHFGTLGSRYDTVFTGTGEISHNTIINSLADPNQRTQLGIGVRSGRNMKINHNNISGNVAEGIHHWSCVNTASDGNYEINHNTIDLSGWVGARIGNNPRGIWSYARSASINYNTVISKWYGIIISYWDDTNWAGATAANNPVTISHNVIHPPAGQNMTTGMRYGGNNGQISDNEIYGAKDTSGYGVGLLFEGWGNPAWGERTECKDNTFTGNDIHDNYDGIWTWGTPYDNRSNNVFHFNDIYNNSNSGMTIPGAPTVDARYNWWGDNSGPGGAGPGTGDAVSANVNYSPWTKQTPTSTGTGTASFTPDTGTITGLTGVAAPAGAPVSFPHGMFSFIVTGITGQVTLTIELPGPMPVGSLWYKYNGGSWDPLPIGDDDGDNIITVTLRDNISPDDEDVILGQITDQGGPSPGAVGWETYSVDKTGVLLPWIALGLAIAAGASLLVFRRRRARS